MSVAATLPLAGPSLGWCSVLHRSATAPGAGMSLDAAQKQFLELFADTLIPATDTPGALGAGVPGFLSLLFEEWLLPQEQAGFVAGIVELNRVSVTAVGHDFSACSADQRLELLRSWDVAADPTFFARLRGLVLVGYYSSEVGQNVELQMQYGAGADREGGPVFGAVPFKI
jgi:hypothetical protein